MVLRSFTFRVTWYQRLIGNIERGWVVRYGLHLHKVCRSYPALRPTVEDCLRQREQKYPGEESLPREWALENSIICRESTPRTGCSMLELCLTGAFAFNKCQVQGSTCICLARDWYIKPNDPNRTNTKEKQGIRLHFLKEGIKHARI